MSRVVRGAVLLVALWAGLGQGATWVVCPADCDYADIQAAIAAASPGDTVLVRPGIYVGDLWLRKPLALRGVGTDPVVIQGNVYVLGTAQVTVHGMTIRDGSIHIEDSSGIVVATCVVEGPGGIVVRSSSATLRGNVITGAGGHGILVTLNSRALIVGNTIAGVGRDGIHVAASMADIRANEVRDGAGYGIWADRHSTISGQAALDSITGNARVALGGSARELDREPPAAPTDLTVTPATWTAGTIAVAWTAPEELTGIAAAWYKLGTAPTGPDDGVRAVGNPFTLVSPPEGSQVAYVWLEDGAGNRSERSVAQVTVLYDRTPPTGRVLANDGARHVFTTGIALTVEATDMAGDEEGSGVASLRLSNDGRAWSAWQPFSASLLWNLVQHGGTPTPGPRTVFLELRDKTGNVGRVATEVTLVQAFAHAEPILSLAFTAAGDLLAYGSPTGVIRILNLATGQELRALRGHTGGVYSVAFSPDGKLLASGSNDNTVRIWVVATGREERVLRGHAGGVWAVAFAPDGRTIASGSSDTTIRLWDAPTGRYLRHLAGHGSPVRAVAFAPNGRLLASGADDRTVRLWEVRTGATQHRLATHAGSVRSVAFSPDGMLVASASLDGRVVLWQVPTGESARTIVAPGGGVRAVVFAPDGKSLASGSAAGMIAVWDVATGRELYTLEGATGPINALAYSPDGRVLASGGDDNLIRLWEIRR